MTGGEGSIWEIDGVNGGAWAGREWAAGSGGCWALLVGVGRVRVGGSQREGVWAAVGGAARIVLT